MEVFDRGRIRGPPRFILVYCWRPRVREPIYPSRRTSFLNSPLSILSKISLVFLFSSLILFNKASICEMFLFSFSSLCSSGGSVSMSASPLSQTPENYQPLSSHYPAIRNFLICKLIFRSFDNSPIQNYTLLWQNLPRRWYFWSSLILQLRNK